MGITEHRPSSLSTQNYTSMCSLQKKQLSLPLLGPSRAMHFSGNVLSRSLPQKVGGVYFSFTETFKMCHKHSTVNLEKEGFDNFVYYQAHSHLHLNTKAIMHDILPLSTCLCITVQKLLIWTLCKIVSPLSGVFSSQSQCKTYGQYQCLSPQNLFPE